MTRRSIGLIDFLFLASDTLKVTSFEQKLDFAFVLFYIFLVSTLRIDKIMRDERRSSFLYSRWLSCQLKHVLLAAS